MHMLDWRSGWGVVALVSVFASGCTRGNPQFADTIDDGADGGDDVAGDDGLEGGVDDDGGGEGSGTGTADDGADEAGTSGDSGSDDEPLDRCGDGRKDTGEQCDNGELNSLEGECLPDCTHNICGDGHTSPTQPCDGERGCVECTWITCGNGMFERETEECDWSDPNTEQDCTQVCTHNICGDMEILGEETCDDANGNESDGCTSLCQPPVCGDNLVSEDIGERREHAATRAVERAGRSVPGAARPDHRHGARAGEAGADHRLGFPGGALRRGL